MRQLDWDSIQEAEGFKIRDLVRARGAAVGIIRNIIKVNDKYRARVHWPTIAFVSEGITCSSGSEQFVDLADLSHADQEQLRLI